MGRETSRRKLNKNCKRKNTTKLREKEWRNCKKKTTGETNSRETKRTEIETVKERTKKIVISPRGILQFDSLNTYPNHSCTSVAVEERQDSVSFHSQYQRCWLNSYAHGEMEWTRMDTDSRNDQCEQDGRMKDGKMKDRKMKDEEREERMMHSLKEVHHHVRMIHFDCYPFS